MGGLLPKTATLLASLLLLLLLLVSSSVAFEEVLRPYKSGTHGPSITNEELKVKMK